MPMHRTVSDRGLWKKYKEQQPQHFHKSNYLQLDKTKPQVSYNNLNLGDNYRSYNSRQSIPNIPGSNLDLSNGDWSPRPILITTKSAPATPRAISPFRQCSRMNQNGFDYKEVVRSPSSNRPENSGTSGQYSRTITNPIQYQMTPSNGYPDSESGVSLESRSLATYSAASSMVGRDWNTGYRYPYPVEPTRQDVSRLQDPSTFSEPLSKEAESVVQMFLMSQNLDQSRFKPQQENNQPGRIQDLDYPDGPSSPTRRNDGDILNSRFANHGQQKEQDELRNTRTAIAQLKKDFFNNTPTKQVPVERKTNKYLQSENRWSGPSGNSTSSDATNSPVLESSRFLEGTVSTFQAPQIHHAEVVNLRQDTSSDSDEDETPTIRVATDMSVQTLHNVKRSQPQFDESPTFQLEELRRQHLLEQEKLHKEFEEKRKKLMEEEEKLKQLMIKSSLSVKMSRGNNDALKRTPSSTTNQPAEPKHQPKSQKADSTPSKLAQNNTLSPERSFEDPAFVNFRILQQDLRDSEGQAPQTRGKKKNFFTNFFKKTPSGPKAKGSRKARPDSMTSDSEDCKSFEDGGQMTSIARSKTDYNIKVRTLESSPQRFPQPVPYPGQVSNGMHSRSSPSLYRDDPDANGPSCEPMPRKLSMSKPTNLDDLIGIQEEDGYDKSDSPAPPPLPKRLQTADDIFQNDPWFQRDLDTVETPIYQNSVPSPIEKTQEIDIDELLGYGKDEPDDHPDSEPQVVTQIEEIVWPKSEPVQDEVDESTHDTRSLGSQGGKSSLKIKSGFFRFGSKKKVENGDEYQPDGTEDGLDPVVGGAGVIDIIAQAAFDDDIAERRKNKKVKKKSGISGMFHTPSWKSSKKTSRESIGDPPPRVSGSADVTHLLDDGFGIEDSPSQTGKVSDTDQSVVNGDEVPVEVPLDPEDSGVQSNSKKKQIFKFKFGKSKKNKNLNEEEDETFDFEDGQQEIRNPKIRETIVETNDKGSSAEDVKEDQAEDQDVRVEQKLPKKGSKQLFKSPSWKKEKKKSHTLQSGEESNVEDDVEHNNLTALNGSNVEEEEEDPPQPADLRNEPEATKRKSQRKTSGLSGLFGLPKPRSQSSDRGRSSRRPTEEVHGQEGEPEITEDDSELSSIHTRRKRDSKGFDSLFGSKRRSRRQRPVSVPPPETTPDNGDETQNPGEEQVIQKRRSRNSFGSFFGTKRDASRARSTSNLSERPPLAESVPPATFYENVSHHPSRKLSGISWSDKGHGNLVKGSNSSQKKALEGQRSTSHPPISRPDVEQVSSMKKKVSQQSSSVPSEDEGIPVISRNAYPIQRGVHQPHSQPPVDPHRQMGRRSGRFRKPTDGVVTNPDSGQVDQVPITSNDIMRDLFAESVAKKSQVQRQQSLRNQRSEVNPDYQHQPHHHLHHQRQSRTLTRSHLKSRHTKIEDGKNLDDDYNSSTEKRFQGSRPPFHKSKPQDPCRIA